MTRTKKEMLEQIEMLEKVAKENKEIAIRALTQAKEWKAMYESVCTDEDDVIVSLQTH